MRGFSWSNHLHDVGGLSAGSHRNCGQYYSSCRLGSFRLVRIHVSLCKSLFDKKRFLSQTFPLFRVNPLDLAPNHASVILGFSNMIGTIPGIVSPLLTGYITSERTKEQWQIVFYITSGIYCFGCVIYWFFSSGELQPWANAHEKSLENPENPTTKNPTMNGIKNEAMEMDE